KAAEIGPAQPSIRSPPTLNAATVCEMSMSSIDVPVTYCCAASDGEPAPNRLNGTQAESLLFGFVSMFTRHTMLLVAGSITASIALLKRVMWMLPPRRCWNDESPYCT